MRRELIQILVIVLYNNIKISYKYTIHGYKKSRDQKFLTVNFKLFKPFFLIGDMDLKQSFF